MKPDLRKYLQSIKNKEAIIESVASEYFSCFELILSVIQIFDKNLIKIWRYKVTLRFLYGIGEPVLNISWSWWYGMRYSFCKTEKALELYELPFPSIMFHCYINEITYHQHATMMEISR